LDTVQIKQWLEKNYRLVWTEAAVEKELNIQRSRSLGLPSPYQSGEAEAPFLVGAIEN
jgi:hypothetical protein